MTRSTTIKHIALLLTCLAAASINAGCTHLTKNRLNNTARVQETATPDARPFDTFTDFAESLQCMDDYLIRYKVRDLSILVVEDRDVTGQVVGAKDMAVTALSKMARKSKSIRVVSIAPTHASGVDAYFAGVGDRVPPNSDRRTLPKYFITISMPQIDNAISADRKSAGMRILGAVGLEYDSDKLMSSMSIDLNMGNMLTASSIPGVYSSNTVAIKRTGNAIGGSGEINKLGAVFSVSTDRSEGFHHSLRQLVELGAIELIGRLTQIPYWECLNISTSNEPVQRQIQDWYESLTPRKLLLFTQNKLRAKGLYRGAIDGADSNELRQAIALFRQGIGVLPSANLDATLFRHLLSDKTPFSLTQLARMSVQTPKFSDKLYTTKKVLFARTRPLKLEMDIGPGLSFSPGQPPLPRTNSSSAPHMTLSQACATASSCIRSSAG